MPPLSYYRRIFSAYLLGGKSHLTFWHETPAENPRATPAELGEYYMQFAGKADYQGSYDSSGVPQLDYHGQIGLQYNPIAIAQYGLGNYNLFRQSADPERRRKFLIAADWLCSHLEQNVRGFAVWNHHFDWEYRDTLRAPWYSALAQGQGISVLLRADKETQKESGDTRYLAAARRALACFHVPMKDGGVAFTDESGDLWFEEYIVSPPTHILNGFIWAAWGLYDYFLATQDISAQELFSRAVRTLLHNLDRYDLGFWSLYEQSGTRLPMVASPFYHQLHIVQLRVMHRLTGESTFARVADRWETYTRSRTNRARALAYKSVFKLCYY
ncbi:MAG TPA: D-glucuronyl C5-epimerase family protein [Candidatus Sulfotelmatobacter sp.]|nr:D-glucuronyl C5-epimerase family protein [Candidatus Sulfotelmatobacter sp.]